MTYEQVVTKLQEKFANADASKIDGVVALQVNVEGLNTSGILYIEVKDHNVNVAPYDYHDRSALVTINPTNLIKLVDGKLTLADALKKDKIVIEGDEVAVKTVLNLVK